jgi:hypothetical protein
MNERIKEIARQAGVLADFGEDIKVGRWSIGGNYENMQRFAELIVRECAEVCYDHSNAAGGVDTHFGYGYKDCGDDIKRNFGVEL